MGNKEQDLLEFGPFRLDAARRLLLREDNPVPLQPKAFDTLLVLVRNSERVVAKEDLMNSVWPDTFVEESNLTQNIFVLRKALEEGRGERRYIITVPGRGYRFAEKVRTIPNGQPTIAAVADIPSPPTPAVEETVLPAPRVHKLSWKIFLPIAVALLALAGFAWWYFPRPHGLTDKDTIVLAEFANTTGEPVFDGTLRQGLSAQLDQSPYLNLLSDQRIAQTLKLMAKPRDARLTHELARDVCQRSASAATVEGSIGILGSQYVVGLRAVACRTGDVLAEQLVTANGKEQVLKALGEAASKLRRTLGESLPSLQKYDAPPDAVTTASLEALQAYTLGLRALTIKDDSLDAITYFQTAVTLDPDFAMAYARMGTCYLNLDQITQAADNTRTAYRLRERTGEREKLYIASHYHVFVTGNLEAARVAYELWAQTYPRDFGPRNDLGIVYGKLGQYDKALRSSQEALQLNPGSGQTWQNLAVRFLNLNRLDEAKKTIRKAQDRNLDTASDHFNSFLIDYLQHDESGMEREAADLLKRPGYDDEILQVQASVAACSGKLGKAREFTRLAVEAAKRADRKESEAAYLANAALREALTGHPTDTEQQARAALALANSKTVEGRFMIAMALSDDSAGATHLAADLNARFPEDTLVQHEYLPMARSALALRRGDSRKAVDALASAMAFETGTAVGLLPAYLRGEAWLAAKDGNAAAREFRRVLDYPGVVLDDPIGPLAHLGLGRALALTGDSAKAKLAYQEFLALWKDGDPDLPVFTQAKAEYAKLTPAP